MKVIGLTGPSGAGKTLVAELMEMPTVNADQIARQVHKDPSVLQELCCRFGEDILSGGVLNRPLLASRAFANRQATDDLNSIMHPRIVQRIQEELDRLAREGECFCLLDAPLLFEAECYHLCHATVCVLAHRDVRKNRIMERDGITGEMAEKRMGAQPEDEYYQSRCDHVIWNNGNISDLQQDVKNLLKQIKEN